MVFQASQFFITAKYKLLSIIFVEIDILMKAGSSIFRIALRQKI
jgi:hypothetical protein